MAKLDTLRILDVGLLNWLRDPVIGLKINGQPIPAILAGPERAFSELAETIGKKDANGNPLIPQFAELINAGISLKPEQLRSDASLIPLPFASVVRQSIGWNDTRWAPLRWRRVFTSHHVTPDNPYGFVFGNAEKSTVVQSKAPRPIDVSYQLDLWCRYRDDQNSLIAQLLTACNPLFTISFDFKIPWGEQLMDLFLDGPFTNNDDIESESDQSWKRLTVPFRLQAYYVDCFEFLTDIPSRLLPEHQFIPMTTTYPTVKTFDITVSEEDHGQLHDEELTIQEKD